MSAPASHAYTNSILIACARICAEAIDAASYVFTAGMSEQMAAQASVLEDSIVPLEDDFSEQGMPVITLALGSWIPLLGGGLERVTFNLQGRVWRERAPLGENTAALNSDRDAIADAVIAHSKGFNDVVEVQSVILMGGPGIRAASVPQGASGGSRTFLTLPFDLQVKAERPINPKPA